MKIAFLEYKMDGLRGVGIVFLVFGGLLLVIGGFPLLDEKRDPDFAAAVVTALAGAILVLVGLVFLWGLAKLARWTQILLWRYVGYREICWVLWKIRSQDRSSSPKGFFSPCAASSRS